MIVHEGEHLFATERMVVSPAAGVFAPEPERSPPGSTCEPGTVLGHVGDQEVRSPFAGVAGGRARRRRRAGHRQPAHRLAADRVSAVGRSALPTGVRGATITGWGTALPRQVVTNADLEARLDTSDEWIIERTGIHERRVGGTTAGLAIEAGRAALDRWPA